MLTLVCVCVAPAEGENVNFKIVCVFMKTLHPQQPELAGGPGSQSGGLLLYLLCFV